MSKTITAYIALGSNLGNRAEYINKALAALAESGAVKLARTSRLIETSPLGRKTQPDYLNATAQIKTSLDAGELFQRLLDIEASLGRARTEKWAPRTIDLDLLLFNDQIINTPMLTVPHPQMHLRSFVLAGLSELNSALVHPVIKQPVSELVSRLNGRDFVLNTDAPQLVCTAGVIGVGKTTLAKALAKALHCKLILEAYDTNPFMPAVYAGRKELALDSQLYFLTSRVDQLGTGVLAPGRIAVTDYIFDKELIYVRRLLGLAQQSLYRRVTPPLAATVTQPVLAIYLQDCPENCLQRVHKRNRPYEQQIELNFLRDLGKDYDVLFADWKACPLLRISMSQFDCTNENDVARLADEIRSYVAVKE